MAGPSTLTEQLDNLYTTTWQNMKSDVADNIFDATPFWFWMRSKGRLKTVVGGRNINVPLRYAKSDNVAWITKGKTVTLDDKEFLTVATYNWRYLTDSIVRFGIDDQQNRGKNQIINLMSAKLDNSKDTLIDTLETALFAVQSGNQIFGLQDLVPDDPTQASPDVGKIDGADNTWWRSQTKDMTGLSFSAHGVPQMRTMNNNTANNLKSDATDIIVAGQTPYERYEDEIIEQKRIVNKTLGDAGFETIEFKGKPMIWSPACADTRMYFLNTNFLNFTYDPGMFFDMTEWKAIPNQVNDRVAQVITAGELTMNRRRCQGVLFNLDTD